MTHFRQLLFTLVIPATLLLMSCGQQQDEWTQLFNGEDLTGWTPKITGYEYGENFGNTFRVEEGLLKVGYDEYDTFGQRFGHLFYEQEYSNYHLRLEYRFVGEQVNNGPGWALRNSGIMIHGQDPATMTLDQEFPVSIEVQLLGGDGTNPRTTGNLCTPGTNVVMGDELITRHCTNSNSETYHGEQWVTAEVIAHGNGMIYHIINGDTVLSYTQSQLDETDPDAQRLIESGQDIMISGGTISLQSESHPVHFRKIEIKELQ
ncbi:MAG: DUF1080 domain-containing protein [Candidatus Marinimicrobia bacterium]|nr:DUF1080 domain-containing protein [Candidatus Neomarinimicrobiota bacterium]